VLVDLDTDRWRAVAVGRGVRRGHSAISRATAARASRPRRGERFRLDCTRSYAHSCDCPFGVPSRAEWSFGDNHALNVESRSLPTRAASGSALSYVHVSCHKPLPVR
jgi:hypothetical protein